ncbi:hypothetical protein K438DRAFT_2027314 [Mycena galopus ATCC 62051]|nr:hypothetical protein K438DRAFT_2027314 [Mycena galopus ATCC 62051]
MTVCSSDGVLFKVHRKHLEVHSEIFADAAGATGPENGDEIVHLEESSDVLDLLFQYMYRQPQPDLHLVPFSAFMGLAEAVEKYVVYSALPAVMIRIKDHMKEHPLDVLDFAAKHGHMELGNEAARLSVTGSLPISDAARTLAPDTFAKWMVFYDNWNTAARKALSLLIQRGNPGESLYQCVKDPQLRYKERPALKALQAARRINSPSGARVNLVDLTFLDCEFMR